MSSLNIDGNLTVSGGGYINNDLIFSKKIDVWSGSATSGTQNFTTNIGDLTDYRFMILQVEATTSYAGGKTGTIVVNPYDGALVLCNSVDGVQYSYDMRLTIHNTNVVINTANRTRLVLVTLIK